MSRSDESSATWIEAAAPAPPEPAPPELELEDLGPIGAGAMGEVRRMRDPVLDRLVAVKSLPEARSDDAGARARFLREARMTARLQHPNVLPIHALGTLEDGRPCFTMPEVTGQTLEEAALQWPLARRIAVLRQVCEAVAYAHDRGVLHLDLKPENVMVGRFGVVLVLDWGIAQEKSRPGARGGGVAGTPAYMAPEQARGEALGPQADVYALGGMLWFLLEGRPPHEGEATEILARLQSHVPDDREPGPTAPRDLVAICSAARAFRPQDRLADAGALAAALESWLDGALQRTRALRTVEQADALFEQASEASARAARLQQEAELLRGRLQPFAPASMSEPVWALEDQAATVDRQRRELHARYEGLLERALVESPGLADARTRLAAYYRAAHAQAEAVGDQVLAGALSHRLARHDDGTHTAYLRGTGALTLRTDPPGALVRVAPVRRVARRSVPGPSRALGRTPLLAVPMEPGSYLLTLEVEGRPPVVYPIHIDRSQHWDGIPPGGKEARPVWIPPPGALHPFERYVPAGWCQLSPADAHEVRSEPTSARRWLDAFAIDEHPITHGDYLTFLNALVREGREEDALRWVPRERAGTLSKEGAAALARDASGDFVLAPDSEGDLWDPAWPAFLVSVPCAEAYLAWRSARLGAQWRLPTDREWEKAGRGADGRRFPWGDFLHPSWCRLRASVRDRPLPARIEEHPVDTSPYGVRHLAGNIREWTATAIAYGDMPHRVIRGGAWNDAQDGVELTRRTFDSAEGRYFNVGFRGARDLGR